MTSLKVYDVIKIEATDRYYVINDRADIEYFNRFEKATKVGRVEFDPVEIKVGDIVSYGETYPGEKSNYKYLILAIVDNRMWGEETTYKYTVTLFKKDGWKVVIASASG